MPGSLAVVSFLLLMAAVWLLFSLLFFVYVQSTWNMSYFINRGPENDSAMFCGMNYPNALKRHLFIGSV